ncbi:MAG: DUF4082 domain-containing protein [Cytophagales bacterium]|nr:MAG: DUF4082 domain-containing protein [Cytophagales bacterium]
MRTILHVGVLIALISLFGCDQNPFRTVKPTENPVTNFLDSETGNTISTRTTGPWELGMVFSSSVNGKITKIGSRMPEPGTYRIIIWDFDSKQALRQKSISQTAADKLEMTDVEWLTLTPNKKYVISINSQGDGINKKYAVVNKTGGVEFLPFARGSILVYNTCSRNTATPAFPDGTQNVKNELYGFVDFMFEADN